MSSELKDFSMYLSNELMRLFGDPYQSSITAVRRFEKGNLRVYVDYERERDEVNIHGLAAIGGVTLMPNDALAFIEEIQKTSGLASTYRIDLVGKNINIFPMIDFGAPLGSRRSTAEKKIQRVVYLVKMVFSDLEKIEEIVIRYRKKEVGYPEVEQIWQEALKSTDTNEKGKLLEQVFVRLFQLDGSFVVVEHNVRTETEEIDIVVQPDTSSPFWSRVSPPMLLLECKNWKDKIGTPELQVFATKIENRPKLLCRIGYLISISGFTDDAEKELIGYRARDFVLATITADHIKELVEKRTRISDLLKERLIEAGFR
jgi:hypothetical protein